MVKYIISHKNPDTDTICSSIIYSIYLKRKENIDTKVIKLGELNNETKFVLKEFNFKEPETKTELEENSEIILTDHNEEKQSIDNRKRYKLIQIIDHHKIDLKTQIPLFIRTEPIGATCSIIAKMFFENNIQIKKNEASLLISAIISDTLYFRSPTTTKEDIELVKKLNQIAEIKNLEVFSLNLFDRKSDLGNLSIEEIIKLDYKEFNMNNKKIGIGIMETTNVNYGLDRKEEIIKKMKEILKKENLNYLFLSIVDILNEKNYTIYANKETENLLKIAFNAKIKNNLAELGNIISRKKQIVPAIEKILIT